jgi:hypothetical protein
MGPVWGRTEIHTGFWQENLKVRYHLKDPGIHGMIILNGLKDIGWEGVD